MDMQLVVTYADNTIMFYPVNAVGGWKIDAASRCLIVGRGLPRTYVPLDQVRSFVIERFHRLPRSAITEGRAP